MVWRPKESLQIGVRHSRLDREPRNHKKSWNPGLVHWKVFAMIFHIFFNIPSKEIMGCNLTKSHIAQSPGFQLSL